MRSNLLLVCVLVVACGSSTAQNTLTRDNLASWQPQWRFAPGDDMARAAPDFDDSSWETRTVTVTDPGYVDSTGWRGVGWYRTTFVLDSLAAGHPIGYRISLLGAAEIFVDGTLVAAVGAPSHRTADERAVLRGQYNPHVGALPVLSAGLHHMAVRVSNLQLSREGETRFGFELTLGEPLEIAERTAAVVRRLLSHMYLFTGAAAVLAIVFLLLFAFQPKQINNLYFGLLSLLSAFVIFADLQSRLATDPPAYLDWRRYMELAAVAGWIVAVRLVRVSFFKESWRLFYPLIGLAALVALHVYFDPIGGFWTLTIFSVIAMAELLRRVGLAVFLSRPGAVAVAVGAALFAAGAVHDYVTSLGWMEPIFGFTNLIHMGLTGFLALFALFLGTDFARANRSLEHRISQVTEESQRALQDEKVNQNLRIERIQAEFDSRRKEFEERKSREVDDIRKSLTVEKEHLKEMQERLIHAEGSASLGKLVTGIAHDTNDLLATIDRHTSSSSELVDELGNALSGQPKKGQVDDVLKQLRKNLVRIQEQIKTVRGLVGDILQHGSLASSFEPVEVNALLERYLNLTVHGAKGEFPDMNLVVEKVFDHRAGTVEAMPARLGRAVMGILRNAIESLAEHRKQSDEDFQPTITVSTQRLDHAVLIRIRDNGPGVPQELRDKVFEPFFSTSHEKPGLGLSVAHQTIVDELDGTFGLEHFKEQGAGFYITIPFKRKVVEEAEDVASE